MDSPTIGFVVKLKYVAVEKTLNSGRLVELEAVGFGGATYTTACGDHAQGAFLGWDESQTLWPWQMTQVHRTFRVPLADRRTRQLMRAFREWD